MAVIEHDFSAPGRLVLRSATPQSLAQVPDILQQTIGGPNDVLAAWAVHPSEQDGWRDDAYRDEIALVGPHALVHIEELSRPRQENVVWIDRYHFTCAAVRAANAGPLLGMYVTTRGRIAIYVHPPDSSHLVNQHVGALPFAPAASWDNPEHHGMARYLVAWTPRRPGAVTVQVAPPVIPDVAAALEALPG